MSKPVMAWHFVGDTLRDGRVVPPDGEWLTHRGDLRMCAEGLHASEHPFDALEYAPGPILCRVECAGTIVRGADKLVCSERRIVARMDATELLRYFARMQALSVIHLWPTDPPDVVLDYLMTGDESTRAEARAEAMAAAAAARAARAAEQELCFFAEQVVQVLVEMVAPGTKWLFLTETEGGVT
jgi:hypothetical protein